MAGRESRLAAGVACVPRHSSATSSLRKQHLRPPVAEGTVEVVDRIYSPFYLLFWRSTHGSIRSCSSLFLPLVFVSYVEAGDLFRLYLSGPNVVESGTQFDLRLVVDNDEWPPGSGSTIDPSVIAFTFGLEIPAPLTYVGHSFTNTIVDSVLTGDVPLFDHTVTVTQGVNSATLLSESLDVVAPGLAQLAMGITLAVPAGAPTGIVSLAFRDDLGDPEIPIQFVTPDGNVVPATRGIDITIVAPSGGGSSAAASGGGGSSIVAFPLPLPEELGVTWIGSSAPAPAVGVGGTAAASGAGGGSDLTDACDYQTSDLRPVLPATPDAEVPTDYDTIQAAIDSAAGASGDYFIRVLGKIQGMQTVYSENLEINPDDFSGATIYLYTLEGPEWTVIDGGGLGPVIEIEGSVAATEGGVVIGGTDSEYQESSPPSGYPGWYGFTIRNGASTGFIGGPFEGAGVRIVSTEGPVEVRGNVITDNPTVGVAQDLGGGIGISDCNDGGNVVVRVVMNEISDNLAVGGGLANFGGGGISIVRSAVLIANNWIFDNGFEELATSENRKGGGVYCLAELGNIDETDVRLCRNWIKGKARNRAVECSSRWIKN